MSKQHLRVYADKSEFVYPDGTVEVFFEGISNPETQQRYKNIQQAFGASFLENQILYCRDASVPLDFGALSSTHLGLLDRLATSVTSEVGRALVALVIMQLCVKTIEPEQSIRLHKGGRSSRDFSWREGISMRSLDKNHVTPTLRKYDLVKLNADGFMMTRSLAENYPYSIVYKAKIRGARDEWLLLIESIEAKQIDTHQALLYLLSQLINQASAFNQLADETLALVPEVLRKISNHIADVVQAIVFRHINNSGYAARVMEIAMHSLMQAIKDLGGLPDTDLKPLSQMRSANKKHGNVGDIELLENRMIVESWDAKFGKTYLRDEIEELADKLIDHPEVRTVGFVTSAEPEHLDELEIRMGDIEGRFGVDLRIIPFTLWVKEQVQRAVQDIGITEGDLFSAWLRAFAETIAQKRRDIAPIDEPCYRWLEILKDILRTHVANS
jgi:hypothetical protein